MDMSVDIGTWKDRVLPHCGRIDRLAVRRFGAGVLAEEAALYVLEGLEEDDWRRVKTFSGRASFGGFIAALAARLLEDFARRRYGRRRPPAWISAMGGIWRHLFQLLCLERFGLDEAVEIMATRHGEDSRAEMEAAARTIRGRVTDCGAHQAREENIDDQVLASELEAKAPVQRPEHRLLDEERKLFLQVLFGRIVEGRGNPGDPALEALARVRLHLDTDERLLLMLHFQDGLSVVDAGAMLGLNRNQAHGRLRRLLERLRTEFDQAGIGDELRLLLRG